MKTLYQKGNGQFHLYRSTGEEGSLIGETQLVHSSERVAVAYCQLDDRLHIFTHGAADGMKQWAATHNASASPHKASLKEFGQDASVDVVNAAIADPAELARWI
jgi:hypothetical protein